MSILRQNFFIPKPTLTEQNCPDQKGRIHIVTGGYGGVGYELSKILYQHNATLYIAGRSPEKSATAISKLKQLFPTSTGTIETLTVDFSDLTTIKPAAQSFLSAHPRLDGLTLNHGVGAPPKGSQSAQGHELQIATNCLGSYLFYSLLRPALVASSRENPALARVTWASSLAVELQSPKPGGIAFVSPSPSGGPATPRQDFSQQTLYAQTKAGNSHLAAVLARRDRSDKILHLAFNPGNLNTDLLRHLPAALAWVLRTMVLYPARFGAYTELWALLGEVGIEASGSYVAPWGRVERMNREDLRTALEDGSESGVGARFLGWVERETEKFS